MSSVTHSSLPCEMWLEIFSHLDKRSYVVSHAPFQAKPGAASTENVSSAYSRVVLVCRNWRAWAIELLYRDLKLPDRLGFEAVDVPRGYGRWVRRAVVPYSTTTTETWKPMPSTELLSLCPNLEVLVRPPLSPLRSLKFEFDAPCPSLLSLKRLDWWIHSEASRSGGINSLIAVLVAAPNLEYLFIGGAVSQFTAPFHGLGGPPIHLSRLRTLRLSVGNALLLRHILYRWDLPALDNLVVDAPLGGVNTEPLWEALGSQLSVVEFGRHSRFLLHQHLAPCLRSCHELRELNYYVFITMAPEVELGEAFPSVTIVGIHMSEAPLLGGEEEEWVHLERHFHAFAGGMFPNLRRLRIYEMRESMMLDPRFASILKLLVGRECIVEFPDRPS